MYLALVGAAHAAQDCPCEPCVEGVGMRDNASWGFYRLSDVYAHTLSSYNACFWPRSLACDYSNKRTHLSDLDAFLAAVRRRLARTPETPPAADEVVWHLRLGDTVDCDDAFERPCARNAKYVLQRPFFEAVAARLRTAFSNYADLRHAARRLQGRRIERRPASGALARAFLPRYNYCGPGASRCASGRTANRTRT